MQGLMCVCVFFLGMCVLSNKVFFSLKKILKNQIF